MTCSHPRATNQVCHALYSAYRFLSGILRLRGPFGLGGLGLFRLSCANVAFGLFGCSAQKTKNKNKKTKTKKKEKKIVCLFDIRYSFRFERFIIPLRVE